MADIRTVKTGNVRLSFPHLAKPQAPMQEGGEPSYAVTMMIPKTDEKTPAALKAAQEAAIEDKWGSKRPKRIAQTIKDGDKESLVKGDDGVDTEKYPEYAGHWIVTTRNTRKPEFLTKKAGQVVRIDPNEFYAGCFAKVALQAFAYDRSDGQGVTFSLQGVFKTGDGERLAGGGVPFSMFDDEDDYDEDLDESELLG